MVADRQEKLAALAREQARLAEIAAAQERTGRGCSCARDGRSLLWAR
jgi:hypothetical protein